MNLSTVEKHQGSGVFGASTYHLYEPETNYLTALSLCEVGLIVNTEAVVSLIDR